VYSDVALFFLTADTEQETLLWHLKPEIDPVSGTCLKCLELLNSVKNSLSVLKLSMLSLCKNVNFFVLVLIFITVDSCNRE
jgi:hypothetical protein